MVNLKVAWVFCKWSLFHAHFASKVYRLALFSRYTSSLWMFLNVECNIYPSSSKAVTSTHLYYLYTLFSVFLYLDSSPRCFYMYNTAIECQTIREDTLLAKTLPYLKQWVVKLFRNKQVVFMTFCTIRNTYKYHYGAILKKQDCDNYFIHAQAWWVKLLWLSLTLTGY